VEYIGLSSSEMGLIYTMNGLILTFLSYFLTRWISKINLLTLYSVGAIMFSIACIGVTIVPSFLTIALFFLLFETPGEILHYPVANAITAEIAPEEHKGRYMGVLTLVLKGPQTYGPFIGGILMDFLWSNFMLFWLFFSALGIIAALACLQLKRPLRGRLKK
jgi:MFS family permease